MATKQIEYMKSVLTDIARTYLFVGTLTVRNWDRLDFHDCHVGNIERALLAAYNKGFQDATDKMQAKKSA